MNQILRQYYKKALSKQKVSKDPSISALYRRLAHFENRLLDLLDEEGRQLWNHYIDAAESIDEYHQMEMYKSGFLDGLRLAAKLK